ncbi:MAG: hypothetical protein DMG35_04035 [Acidobacteria bacterium]|nr:MAG: hypothetical protein DMG35_04035 [Acidobacteriota bacterium]
MQIRQALLLGLAYNLYRLRHRLALEDVNRAINRCELLISVASKGVGAEADPSAALRASSRQSTVYSRQNREESPHGAAPDAGH